MSNEHVDLVHRHSLDDERSTESSGIRRHRWLHRPSPQSGCGVSATVIAGISVLDSDGKAIRPEIASGDKAFSSFGDALRKVCVDAFVDGFPVDDSVDVVAIGFASEGSR